MNQFPELRQILERMHLSSDPFTALALFTLAIARAMAALPFVPFLGGPAVSGRVQVVFALLFGVVMYPSLSAGVQSSDLDMYFIYLLKEALIGCVIGVMVQVVFTGVEAAGSLVEFSAGLQPEEIFAPQAPSASGPMSRLLGQAAVALYVTAGVHVLFIRTLADSYTLIPLIGMPAFRPGFIALAEQAGKIAGQFLVIAVQLSLPVILLLMLIKLGSALIFRMSFTGVRDDPFQPLSLLAVYGGLFLAASVMASQIVQFGASYLLQIRHFLDELR